MKAIRNRPVAACYRSADILVRFFEINTCLGAFYIISFIENCHACVVDTESAPLLRNSQKQSNNENS